MKAERELTAGCAIMRSGKPRTGSKKKGVANQNCTGGEDVESWVRFTSGEYELSASEAVCRIKGREHVSETLLKDTVGELFHFGFARNTWHRVSAAADRAEHFTCLPIAQLLTKVACNALYVSGRHDAVTIRIEDIHRRTPTSKLCSTRASVSLDALIRIPNHDCKEQGLKTSAA